MLHDARDPDAVPLPVHGAAGGGRTAVALRDQAVAQRADWVGLEVIAGPAVQIGVDRPHEPVVAAEIRVAQQLLPANARRVRVLTGDADVQPFAAEGDAHLGLLGGRRAVVGIQLHETGRGLDAAPDRLVQPAVHVDFLVGSERHGRHDVRVRGRGRLR